MNAAESNTLWNAVIFWACAYLLWFVALGIVRSWWRER